MKIVGCDLHTRYQQIAMLDEETGELIERRLEHASGEAKEFYTKLSGQVRVGIEATGHTRWFERLQAELGHQLWIGDAARQVARICDFPRARTGVPNISFFWRCGKATILSPSPVGQVPASAISPRRNATNPTRRRPADG